METKKIEVPMTQFSKGAAELAVFGCGQIDNISGSSNNIITFVVDPKNITKNLSDEEKASAKLKNIKLDILQLDATLVGNLKTREFYGNYLLGPLMKNKEQFGQKGQVLLTEAREAAMLGDFENAKNLVSMACFGNADYKRKIDANLKLLNEITPKTVEEQIVEAASQTRKSKTTKLKTAPEKAL